MSRTTDKNYDHLFQVLLCGDSSVGKTCLISRFADNEFRQTHINTIGIDFKLKTFSIGDKRIRLQIWDTAGQERFETLTAQYYRRAQGIMLVYDVTREETFRNVSKWMRNIEDHGVAGVKLVIVGNKVDMEDKRVVTTHKGKKLAKQHNTQFFETSAFKDVNVTEAFTSLTQQVLEQAEAKGNNSRRQPSKRESGDGKNIVVVNQEEGGGGGGGGSKCC